jgi:hypothetical protein
MQQSVVWETLPLTGENRIDHPGLYLVLVLPVEAALNLYGMNGEGCYQMI